MNKLPRARTENIVVQELKGETLVYDLITDQAYNLNETSGTVYKACCEKLAFEELKRKHNLSDDIIYLALDELKRTGLLAAGDSYESPFGKTTRRQVIRKVGLASMIALPVIGMIVAPTATHAASVFICSCPSAAPRTCGYGNSFSIGCYNSFTDCFNAGDGPIARSSCCGFASGRDYVNATKCCTLTCSERP